MKAFKIVAGIVVAAAAVVAVNSASASATASNKCTAVRKPLGQWNSSFSAQSDKITATFKVTGTNCKTPVTLAVWESPSANGQPIEQQKLFSHKTGSFGPGTHTLTTNIPNCFYQADLVNSASPTAPDGGANYHYQNGQIVDGGLMDFIYGGNKKCEDKPEEPEEPEQPEDVCPNIEEMQEEVPEGYIVDEDGNCVVIPEDPETPEEPETPEVKGEQTPEVLPSTGPAAVLTTFAGVTASAGAAHAIVSKRKNRS